jgi:predicted methyltransferase
MNQNCLITKQVTITITKKLKEYIWYCSIGLNITLKYELHKQGENRLNS